MIHKIKYGTSVIEYSVIKSKRRKTSQIMVDGEEVIVRTPLSKDNSEIKKIIQNKASWIFKKQLEFKKRTDVNFIPKKYTKRFLIKQVNFYAGKVGITPSKVNIKKMRTRWGSASKDNMINLNEHLLKAPKGAIDYVILHEICHLKIRNHSHRFWELVQKFMPNYEENRKWLEVNSARIVE
ncbi:MAG: M48 family metallopeptidase [Thaumarchaeota archaeon]|nr:M48 family metallopeptidase [Nitrososphaerota archaeon]